MKHEDIRNDAEKKTKKQKREKDRKREQQS